MAAVLPTSSAGQWQQIRDNLVAELSAETARRLAIVQAGNPPPATYSSGGKSVDWTGYVNAMMELIKNANEMALAAGDDGGLFEERVRAYSA